MVDMGWVQCIHEYTHLKTKNYLLRRRMIIEDDWVAKFGFLAFKYASITKIQPFRAHHKPFVKPVEIGIIFEDPLVLMVIAWTVTEK